VVDIHIPGTKKRRKKIPKRKKFPSLWLRCLTRYVTVATSDTTTLMARQWMSIST